MRSVSLSMVGVALCVVVGWGASDTFAQDDLKVSPNTAVADLYEPSDNWIDTLLATRDRYLKWVAEYQAAENIEMSPWYCSNPIPADSFEHTAFSDVNLDLDGRGADGKRIWRRRTAWVNGTVHNLPAQPQAATYLFRKITASASVSLPVGIGSDDGVELWLNGEKRLSRNVSRKAAPDQELIVLPLQRGENTLLMKIYNAGGVHAFYFSTAHDPVNFLWDRIAQDFPRETGFVTRDMAGGLAVALLNAPEPTTCIREMSERVLSALGEYGEVLRKDVEALKPSISPQQYRQALSLYLRMCELRESVERLEALNLPALRRSIEYLLKTYPDGYSSGTDYLRRLDHLEQRIPDIREQLVKNPQKAREVLEELWQLRQEALLANPLLDFDRLLLVRRRESLMGLPQNWQGNCSLPRSGYDNEIIARDLKNAMVAPVTVYRPARDLFVGDVDLHFDGNKMLFSMLGSHDRWQIWEVGVDGSGLRQVTPGTEEDVDNYDACYLPDERIVFASTRIFQGIPCVGGADAVANLFLMDADGANIRQLCFDQDHNWCPTVLNDGRVMFTRWEYSDTPHYFTRLLFHMNPDGTAQMEYYGSNSYWPNSIFYARPVPNHATQVAAIVSGHHGVARMGELVIFDPAKGRHEADGVVQRIPGYGQPVEPVIADFLVDDSWPKFLHPYPLSEHYLLVSCKPTPSAAWGIYLVDTFDNMLLLHEEPGYALLEPIPLRPTPRPPVIPDRVRLDQDTATVHLTDVYEGPGLKGVPRGAVKSLRLYAFHYTYPGMGGHEHVGVEGPWDVRRILGTVPVLEDGSAHFRVPANTPIAVQPLDAEGKALQVMRSWFTAMPGEFLSCVGCHEPQNMAPPLLMNQAARRRPDEITPWHGPLRGFSFRREVQPVLSRYCVGCHGAEEIPEGRPNFTDRDEPGTGGFTQSYLALHPYVRRPGPESDYHVQMPLEWHAGTSELIQMLQKGHKGVQLDAEAWDRLVTWIDLNVPDHGRWTDHRPIPASFEKRRAEMRRLYVRTPEDDPEAELPPADYPSEYVAPVTPVLQTDVPALEGWPIPLEQARALQQAAGQETRRRLDLGNGLYMDFALIPAGTFVMGGDKYPDALPPTVVTIDAPFWLGETEVTNAQYAQFNPDHDSRYIDKHHKDHTTPGYPANEPDQPVIRISWADALRFCEWLTSRTGSPASLPTEAQWEWACRAGSATPMFFGDIDDDFSGYANLADYSMRLLAVSGIDPKPIPNPTPFQNFLPQEPRYNDGERIMCAVGRYAPNPWGLKDMHGNVSEWTLSTYAPYPYVPDDGRNAVDNPGKKVARGGSWHDRPMRASAAFRLAYQPWQGVYNVGFRVMLPYEEKAQYAAGK